MPKSSYQSTDGAPPVADLLADHPARVGGNPNGAISAGMWEKAVSATLVTPGAAAPPELVSAAIDGTAGLAASDWPAISADGRYVAFESAAANLLAGDTNLAIDVFVKDLVDGTIEVVSRDGQGGQADGFSGAASISADGRTVAFQSLASNLVAGDTNLQADVFVKDLGSGAIRLASAAADGTQGSVGSFDPSLSADGRFVAFMSFAANLVPGDANGWPDVFVKDLDTGGIVIASVSEQGVQGTLGSSAPSISADGRFVAFESFASNLVAGDSNLSSDVFVKDLDTGVVQLASSSASGVPGNGISTLASISADGRYVTFESAASNLVPDDSNGTWDVFVKDLQTGSIVLASRAADGTLSDGASGRASLSADGRYVAFHSLGANLVPDDDNGASDVFVRDLWTGALVLLSATDDDAVGDGQSTAPVIAADASRVAFASLAADLVATDTFGRQQVLFRDMPTSWSFIGTDGADAFVATRVSDSIDGGAGLDTVRFDDTSAAFAIALRVDAGGQTLEVTRHADPADEDLLSGIELLEFTDGTLEVEDLLRGEDTIRALFNQRTGQTLYTADVAEAALWEADPDIEPLAWRAAAPLDSDPDTVPVYRVYSSVFDLYLWTGNAAVRDAVLAEPGIGIEDQGIAFHAYADAASGGTSAIHMLWDWNPSLSYPGATDPAPLNILYADAPWVPFLTDRPGEPPVSDEGVQFWL